MCIYKLIIDYNVGEWFSIILPNQPVHNETANYTQPLPFHNKYYHHTCVP